MAASTNSALCSSRKCNNSCSNAIRTCSDESQDVFTERLRKDALYRSGTPIEITTENGATVLKIADGLRAAKVSEVTH